MLTFPEGRPWSPAAPVVVAGAYAATFGGQLVGAFVLADPRDVLAVSPQHNVADAVDRMQGVLGIAVALAVLFLSVSRLLVLRGRPAQRAQAPLLAGAALTVADGPALAGWVSSTGTDAPTLETISRESRCSFRSASSQASSGRGCLGARRPTSLSSCAQVAASLRERLARVLGDPTLDVAYRLDDGRYVAADGRPLELPEGSDRAVTLVTVQGAEVAALVHDPALLDEPALVESVRATAGLVLENERLAAEVRAQLAEVRASRVRLVAATDAERRRLERNLHDGAQQRLVTLSVALGLAASRGDADAADVLSRAQDEVEEAIAELRELARGIHPTLLREEGLEAAVEALARRTPLPVVVEGSAGDELPDAVELAAYFLVSEALTNVVKHASASEATVRLNRAAGMLLVEVRDDGIGGARAAADSGLAGLRGRLEALDAKLVVESDPGRGTSIRTEIPCGS